MRIWDQPERRRRPGIRGDRTEWTAWALRLGATVPATPAPDGSLWYVQTVCE